jgi:hypothetical protein
VAEGGKLIEDALLEILYVASAPRSTDSSVLT